MFKPFCSHIGLLGRSSGRVLDDLNWVLKGSPSERRIYESTLAGQSPTDKLFSCIKRFSENNLYGGAPKERRRRRAEKRLSKRVFLESPFLLCSLKVFRTFQVSEEQTLRGREETDSPKTPFWTTVSPHDAFAAPLARPDFKSPKYDVCIV